MSLYLLSLKRTADYDENDAMVVRASSEATARALANEQASAEGHIWNDPEKVNCEPLSPKGKAEVILVSCFEG